MTPAETKDLVRLLLSLCPAKAPPITRGFARAWVEALEPYPYQEVKAAALYHARHKPFFPTVFDLTHGLQPRGEIQNDLERARMLLRRKREERQKEGK